MTNNCQSNYLLLPEVMKFQLVATVLLVGSMLVPSLAAPLRDREEGKAKAVLQVIRMLLTSENRGRGELQQAENTSTG